MAGDDQWLDDLGDLILVVLAWAVLVCIVVLSRRARSIHALQGRPWPTWAGFLTELLTFIAFGGLLHIAIYIHQRFVREDEVDDYIPNNRRRPHGPNLVDMTASNMSSVSRMLNAPPDTTLPEWLQPLSQNRALVISPSTLHVQDVLLGRGSFGQVWLGKLGTSPVAVKLLDSLHVGGGQQHGDGQQHGGRGNNENNNQDTRQDVAEKGRAVVKEVNIMKQLRSSNVVLFMGVCLSPLSIVTEYCPHGSLYDVIKRSREDPGSTEGKRLTWERRVRMARDAAAGMVELHSRGVLHRDLKSPNLLVDMHWNIKVADFGLSTFVETRSITNTLQVTNPRWLAPELLSGDPATSASDVYAFGLCMWELLMMAVPFAGLHFGQITLQVPRDGLRPQLPDDPTDIPGGPNLIGVESYVTLLRRCWHQDPGMRPNFATVLTLLQGLVGDIQEARRAAAVGKP